MTKKVYLKPLTKYKSPTKSQVEIVSKLLSIDKKLVPIVVTTRKKANLLVELYSDLNKFKKIIEDVKKSGLDRNRIEKKLKSSVVRGKGRWNKLISYLKSIE